jgi:16S rRNA (adenine1518-N6/adenine1519-N6)-dimethyltransferase
MPIYKPSELLIFLEKLGINPKKALSQNFLIDGNIIRKIVSSADVKPGDVVVEIGPGPGSLTEALLETGAYVIAIEKDHVLGKELERLKSPGKLLNIKIDDVLKFPLELELEKHLKPGQKAKVIANLPYHITTPIVAKIVKLRNLISTMVIMIQEEVARRFIGTPSSPEYSSLTVFLNYYSDPKYCFKVSKHCFYPSPKVDSAVVQLELHEPPLVSNETKFFQMTRTSFEHRRKMLRGSLRELYVSASIEKALITIHKTPKARPEELSLNEFIDLFELLESELKIEI